MKNFIILFFCFLISHNSHSEEVIKVAFSNKSIPMSYGEEGSSGQGVFVHLFEFLDKKLAKYKFEIKTYNWARAQELVHSGQRDVYCTYPSRERKQFSLFSDRPLYVQDYGYIIFNKKSLHAKTLSNISSMEQLESFKFISQIGVKWEEENVSKKIKRVYVNGIEQLLHFLFLRNEGDFIIMPPDQINYYARRFGYLNDVGIKKVNFIPNSNVEYHFGIRKSHPEAKEVILKIDQILSSDEFKKFQSEQTVDFKN